MRRPSENGAIPDGWQRVRLGDVADFQQGGTPAKANPAYWDGNVPFVTGADLGQRRIGRDSARSFLTEGGLNSGSTVICNTGDLLLATRTRVGLVGIASEVLGASQDITLVEPKDEADCGFLYRVLDSRADELQRKSRGTTIQGVTREDVDSLPILLPPLPEQRAIAAVLDSIDDAIEGAEAVIAATERLRDALLHDLLTRGLPGQHTEFREVPGLGTIPADWQVVRLGEVGQWYSGGTPSKSRPDYWSGCIPWVSPKDMKVREITDSSDRISEEAARAGSRVVSEGTIFVVVRGMILAHSVPVAMTAVPCAFNQDIRALITSEIFNPRYVLAALESLKTKMLDMVTPSTHGTMRIVREDLHDIRIPLPPLPEQQAIAATLDRVDAAIEVAREEAAGLRLLKDSTADALLTGRVRIKDAQ